MELSHIPIIFLTAKNDIDSKINGLKYGAEAYVEKPFSFNYLKEEQILVGTHGQYTPAIGAALFYVKEFIQSV